MGKSNKIKEIIIKNDIDDYIEDDDDDSNIDIEPTNNIMSFKIEDKSIEELNNQIIKQRIIFNSDYQRSFVWNIDKQIRLIDSIFIGMPIPPIWLVKRQNDRKLEVIDGLQRINTICEFLKDNIRLNEKKVTFKPILGKVYSELSENYKLDFLDYAMKLSIVNEESYSDKNIIYELFKRINQNTEPLTKQELRNATFLSEFNNNLREFARKDELITKLIPNNIKKRMKDIEMFYRFLSTFENYDKNGKKIANFDSVDKNVTDFMKKAIKFNNDENNFYLEKLKNSINKVYKVFGIEAFRKFENSKYKNSINVPLMELQLIVIGSMNNDIIDRFKKQIKSAYEALLENEEVLFSLRAATSSTENINLRIEKFNNLLKKNGVM